MYLKSICQRSTINWPSQLSILHPPTPSVCRSALTSEVLATSPPSFDDFLHLSLAPVLIPLWFLQRPLPKSSRRMQTCHAASWRHIAVYFAGPLSPQTHYVMLQPLVPYYPLKACVHADPAHSGDVNADQARCNRATSAVHVPYPMEELSRRQRLLNSLAAHHTTSRKAMRP